MKTTIPGGSVGLCIAAAMARAAELEAASARRLKIRIYTEHGEERNALTVTARIAARTDGELGAQQGRGTRRVPWSELDARAGELVALVEEVAADVQEAVAAAPAPAPRPSRSEEDFDADAYDDLITRAYRALTAAAGEILLASPGSLSGPASGEAITMAALKLAALSSLGVGMDRAELDETLKDAVTELRGKGAVPRPVPGKRRYDA